MKPIMIEQNTLISHPGAINLAENPIDLLKAIKIPNLSRIKTALDIQAEINSPLNSMTKQALSFAGRYRSYQKYLLLILEEYYQKIVNSKKIQKLITQLKEHTPSRKVADTREGPSGPELKPIIINEYLFLRAVENQLSLVTLEVNDLNQKHTVELIETLANLKPTQVLNKLNQLQVGSHVYHLKDSPEDLALVTAIAYKLENTDKTPIFKQLQQQSKKLSFERILQLVVDSAVINENNSDFAQSVQKTPPTAKASIKMAHTLLYKNLMLRELELFNGIKQVFNGDMRQTMIAYQLIKPQLIPLFKKQQSELTHKVAENLSLLIKLDQEGRISLLKQENRLRQVNPQNANALLGELKSEMPRLAVFQPKIAFAKDNRQESEEQVKFNPSPFRFKPTPGRSSI